MQARNYVKTASPNSKSPHFLGQAPHLQCRNVPTTERPRSQSAASTCASLPLTWLTDSGALLSPLRLCLSRSGTTFALSPLRPSQPLRLLIHLPVVHLTPGAHIVWVRGQMHGGRLSPSIKRRGCEGRIRSHDRSRQTDEKIPADQKRTRVAPRGRPSTPRGVGRNLSLTASLNGTSRG